MEDIKRGEHITLTGDAIEREYAIVENCNVAWSTPEQFRTAPADTPRQRITSLRSAFGNESGLDRHDLGCGNSLTIAARGCE